MTISLSPTAIFEVWHNHQIFSEEAYKTAEKSLQNKVQSLWAESKNFVAEEVLYISESKAEEIGRGNKCELTFLTELTQVAFLPRMIPEFFKIVRNTDGFSLVSLPTDSVVHGYPLRKSAYTLYTFQPNVPVRLLINTRTWHTMSSRRATQYFEYDFIYHYRGFFTEYTLSDQPNPISQSCENIKTIDLRKILF